tara:strand:+ start:671 stop:829 length:159 start_codon:yes stop_codon:yes gene_type:complete
MFLDLLICAIFILIFTTLIYNLIVQSKLKKKKKLKKNDDWYPGTPHYEEYKE